MSKTPANTPLATAPTVSAPPTESGPGGIAIQPMVAPAPKKGSRLERGGASSSGRPGQIVSAANRWRENYNPLRWLDMRRAVDLLELGQRGDYAYLQWTYRFIERRNAILSGLLTRCEAPMLQFDWSIKQRAILPQGVSKADYLATAAKRGQDPRKIANRIADRPSGMSDEQLRTMALAQQATLTDAYNRIDNLREAIKHLHKAFFRGYAHLQKHRDESGWVTHLEVLDQWCICRDGLNGNWWWNPDSRSTSAPLQFLGADFCIGGDKLPLVDFIIFECERPIDEIGIVHTVRTGLVEKDWDGFIEIYGIPGGVVEMPSNVPPGKESEYEQAAKAVAEGGSGAIPSGSKYYANDGPRNVDPFTPRVKRLDEMLVLAGTGGKLTMITESGSGGQMRGSSKVHDKTFGEIASARAMELSEAFQKQNDAEILAQEHPGEPALAYFAFGCEEEEDIDALCANVVALKQAGKNANTEWLSEKTGYQLEDVEVPELDSSNPDNEDDDAADSPKPKPDGGKITNRLRGMFQPVWSRLEAIRQIQDPTTQQEMLNQLVKDYPQIAKAIRATPL